ncbi:Scr1 family TA system antitoxin-like transcriptional regulator [Streptomyces sp. NPDC008163]|uniref:Scr1 family TA system antitoxin-like transcriptional regulator n=1 Tax=Streptomyces sp. NPDC008163 TaxID=3364818 RepID=UPI0036E5AD83
MRTTPRSAQSSGRPGSGAVRRRCGCRPAGRRPSRVGCSRRRWRSMILDTFATPAVWVLLEEAALHRAVGEPRVMVEQIRPMVRLMEASRVWVHVMPYRIGAYPPLQSMLTLMYFEDEPPIACSESSQVGRLHDFPTVVTRLQAIHDLALSDALSLTESLVPLRAIAEDYERHD